MKKYKYVFLDLDGTLCNSQAMISLKDKETIAEARKQGAKIAICSGRVPGHIRYIIEDLDMLGNKDDYVICNNSALFINDAFETIKSSPIKHEYIKAITDILDNNGLTFFLYCFDYSIPYKVENIHRRGKNFLIEKSLETKEQLDFFTRNNTVYKISIVSKDFPLLDKVTEELNKALGDKIVISPCSPTNFMEINDYGQDKGSGLVNFCKMMNINIEDTLAIGDNNNDISLLENAGFSACPANGSDLAKKAANYICENDNNNSAVSEVLERFVLK